MNKNSFKQITAIGSDMWPITLRQSRVNASSKPLPVISMLFARHPINLENWIKIQSGIINISCDQFQWFQYQIDH